MREDQAQGLRRLFARKQCRVAAVCGAGGTGACVALASALAFIGYRVCVLDRSVGDAARAIGRRAKYDMAAVLDGDVGFDQMLLRAADGVAVVPAARGLERIAAESGDWRVGLARALPALATGFDVWLVNGLLPGHAPDAPMLLAIDASAPAITNAYGHIKALARAQGRRQFGVVVDGVEADDAARRVFACVADTARRFLAAELELYGFAPPRARHADPMADAARAEAFARMADRLMTRLSQKPLLRTGSC